MASASDKKRLAKAVKAAKMKAGKNRQRAIAKLKGKKTKNG